VFGKTVRACALMTWLTASSLSAMDSGTAIGMVSVDGRSMPLAFAVQTRVENLFDPTKQDTLIVLSDRPLGPTAPDDDVEISLRARRGELAVVALRIDVNKLMTVTVSHKGLDGAAKLPGAWFQYASTKAGIGTLTLDKRDADRHSYGASVEFSAAPYVAAPGLTSDPVGADPRPARTLAEASAASPHTPSAARTTAAESAATARPNQAAVPALIKAMMRGNEYQALEIIHGGVDPNGRDESGMPVLN